MSTMASQITSLTIVCSSVYSGAAQIKHQSSASLSFVKGIHRWPVYSPHKGQVTRKLFPFEDVTMKHMYTMETETSCVLIYLAIDNKICVTTQISSWHKSRHGSFPTDMCLQYIKYPAYMQL